MARSTNGNAIERKRNYAELLDNAELMLDGMDARIARAERELRKLLGNHQNAEKIMQVITRPNDGYGASVGKQAILAAKVRTYRAGLDRERGAEPHPDDDAETADATTDVEPAAESANGSKVAVAA